MAKRQKNALPPVRMLDKFAYTFTVLFSLKKVIMKDILSILFSNSQLVE